MVVGWVLWGRGVVCVMGWVGVGVIGVLVRDVWWWREGGWWGG